MNVTFDRPMVATSVTPGQVLSIMGPVGPITGPQNYPSDSTLQVIPSASSTGDGVLSSTATVPSFDGTFKIAHVSVQMNIAFSDDSDLSAVLIAPDGTQVPLFSGVGALAETSSIPRSTIRPRRRSPTRQPLPRSLALIVPPGNSRLLNGKTVDIMNAAGQWVPGVWTLQITNTATGTTGTLENWSLNITPAITVAPVSLVNGLATTFTIGFPQQAAQRHLYGPDRRRPDQPASFLWTPTAMESIPA